MSVLFLWCKRDFNLDWISIGGNITDHISTAPPIGRVRITGVNQKSIMDLDTNNPQSNECLDITCMSGVLENVYSQTSDQLTGDTRRLSQSPPALLGFLDWHLTCFRIVWTDDEAEDRSGDFLLEKHRNFQESSNLPKIKHKGPRHLTKCVKCRYLLLCTPQVRLIRRLKI